jgi:transcriptional regulator with XRE-family HTH domain
MSALSQLLVRANAAGLSARAIARLAQQGGFSINHDTAARYLRGDHGRPDEQTLRAFAHVLPVRLAELRTAAQLPAEETEPYQPPAEASRLSRRQRRAVDEIIRAMLEPPASTVVTELDGRRNAGRSGPARRRSSKQADPKAARRGDAEPPVK